jgi:hypothetical protein
MVSTAEMGVQTMNKPSENKATITKDDQNKAKPTKGELNEQDLSNVSGGVTAVDGGNLPTDPNRPIQPVFHSVPISQPQGPIK